MRRPAIAALALFLLAFFFGWETLQALRAAPGGQDNAATPAAWQHGAAAPDPPSPPDPMPAAGAVTARPLFRPDRQPFREQAAGASARNYEAELSRYSLLGVLGFGDAPYGVVVGKGGSKGERWEVKVGDALPGFTVKEVGVEGLSLAADGREFLLPLYAGAPPAAGSAVRTETTRRNAPPPASAPQAAAPAPASVAPPPVSGRPLPSPLSNRMRRVPSTSAAPGVSPVPSPPDTPPAVAPRYIPGRR
jgi:hypothetical protein